MMCQRCRGLLVCETFDDLRRDTDLLYTRCINCGCVEDAVVRANRVRSLGGTRTIQRGRRWKGDGARIKVPAEESTLVR